MNITKLTTITAALSATLLLNVPRINAQDAPPPPAAATPAAPAATAAPPAPNAGGGGGGNNDWRQRMNDNIKASLKATDEEWTVIQPLLEKVQEKMRASMGARFGGGGRRGGFGGGNGGGGNNPPPAPGADGKPPGPGVTEALALKTALDADATTPDEIKAKLAALRDARKKAAAELDQAREDLKKVLTLRQEATLVNFGLLD